MVFYYYGAKTQSVRRYPRPTHRTVVEPFAGSAAYSVHHLLHGAIDHAILIEKDPRVAGLWRRLLAMTPAEVRALKPPEPGERTTDFLWMTVATSNALAKASGYAFSARAARKAGSMLRRIAFLLPFVQGRVTLLEGDYTEAPDIEATWFVDPPYQAGDQPWSRGNGYARGCDAAAMDFTELAAFCQSRQGLVIVCEAEGADWLPFRHLRSAYNSLGEHNAEVAWVNQPIDEQLSFWP